MTEPRVDDNIERHQAQCIKQLIEQVADLRQDVDRLKRPIGCVCPADATRYCENQLCPRRAIKMTITGL